LVLSSGWPTSAAQFCGAQAQPPPLSRSILGRYLDFGRRQSCLKGTPIRLIASKSRGRPAEMLRKSYWTAVQWDHRYPAYAVRSWWNEIWWIAVIRRARPGHWIRPNYRRITKLNSIQFNSCGELNDLNQSMYSRRGENSFANSTSGTRQKVRTFA
jgi:hypothetical protein